MLASRKSHLYATVLRLFWKTFDHAKKSYEGLGASMVAENVPKVCEYGCFDEWKFGRVVHSFRKVWTLPKWNCAAKWFSENKWTFVISFRCILGRFLTYRLHDYVAIIWTILFGIRLVNGKNVCENEKKWIGYITYSEELLCLDLGWLCIVCRLLHTYLERRQNYVWVCEQ